MKTGESDNVKPFLMAVLLFIAGCADATGVPENRLLYQDEVARGMLEKALKERNIPFRVDPDGGVWYPAKDDELIDEIRQEIVKVRFGPSVSYEDPLDMGSLKEKLNAAGIRYQTKIQYGREHLTWEKQDEKRVGEILEEVDTNSVERLRDARAKKARSTQ